MKNFFGCRSSFFFIFFLPVSTVVAGIVCLRLVNHKILLQIEDIMKLYQYVQINSAQKLSGKHIKQDANVVSLTGHIIKCLDVSKHFFIHFFLYM